MAKPFPTLRSFPALLTILIVTSCISLAQNPLSDLRPDDCNQYDKVPIPPADLPTEADHKLLASCNSADLYFGIGRVADPVQARRCAYLERERGQQEPGVVFGGAGLLIMIYANGKGAARNFDLALRFSCESGWAPAEKFERFDHLLKLKAKHWTGHNFSLCDDITSGFMMGWCASLQDKIDEQKRTRRLNRIVANWSPADKQAMASLRQAAQTFFRARSENEVDLSGSAHAEFQVEEWAALNNEFISDLRRLERGLIPCASSSEFQQADAKLDVIYSGIESKPPDSGIYGTVTPVNVEAAQKAWLLYREAWVIFGKTKYPTVTPESWKTWLTLKRIKMLTDLTD